MPVRGFTLIELLVVMTISAILIATAVPSFQWFIANSRASNATNSLLAGLQLARSEATRRNIVVVLCRTLNADDPVFANIQCTNAAGAFAAGDWGAGWIVFAKTGALNPADPATTDLEAGDEILMRYAPQISGATRLVIASNIGAGPIAFRGDGTRRNGIGTFSIDYRVPGDPPNVRMRCIAVNVAGAPRVYQSTAGAC